VYFLLVIRSHTRYFHSLTHAHTPTHYLLLNQYFIMYGITQTNMYIGVLFLHVSVVCMVC